MLQPLVRRSAKQLFVYCSKVADIKFSAKTSNPDTNKTAALTGRCFFSSEFVMLKK